MNIFVTRLSQATTADSLRTLFSAYGTVTATRVIIDKRTGQSKCFGFVEMESDEDGENAIETLNEQEFQGRRIVVKPANPREEPVAPEAPAETETTETEEEEE
ncbi:MAG: RNA-binding protein [Odoribacteraceae bacterium]|nr:RNA-binding protein [Odoribacteraceae bacterium]